MFLIGNYKYVFKRLAGSKWQFSDLTRWQVPFNQRQVVIDIMVPRHRVEDQMQRPHRRHHARCLLGDDELVGAHRQGRHPLPRRRGDGHYSVAHGLGQSDAHLAQAADVDNADALAAASGLPGIERRVHSDAL